MKLDENLNSELRVRKQAICVYLGNESTECCKAVSQVGGALITAQRIHQDPEDTS